MAGVHTVPISFRVEPAVVADAESRKSLLKKLCPIIEDHCGPLTEVCNLSLPGGQHQKLVYATNKGSTLDVKLYPDGLVTASLEHSVQDENKQAIAVDDAILIEKRIESVCGASMAKVLPGIKRAPAINPYYTSSDDRILEYDVDAVVFQEQTPHQKVEIVHTKSFGNMLVLDNLQNLAESDLSYTHGLMNKGVEQYAGKTCLILGGGDGALLYELLKENPKHVLMIDIDEAVMRSCKQHMRSVCGTVLDTFKGDNYEIIVDDAIVHLRHFVKTGRQFDYVFADLTDVPITPEPVGDLWNFLHLVMNLGTNVLKPGCGRYLTHAIGVQCAASLSMFETQLKKVDVGVFDVTRTEHYVPSFKEKWCFFQATRQHSTQ